MAAWFAALRLNGWRRLNQLCVEAGLVGWWDLASRLYTQPPPHTRKGNMKESKQNYKQWRTQGDGYVLLLKGSPGVIIPPPLIQGNALNTLPLGLIGVIHPPHAARLQGEHGGK